jgi:hypothetical protein
MPDFRSIVRKVLTYTKSHPYIVGGIGGFLLLATGGIAAVVFSDKRGKRLTHATVTEEGKVLDDPYDLASQAGLPLETYSLARAISSEAGSGTIKEQIGIAWAVKNEARRSGKSIFQITTKDGRYQRQWGANPYVSSRQDPYERDAEIAQAVISGSQPDPTNSGTHFFNPVAQDRGFAKGDLTKNAKQILDARKSQGFVVSSTIDSNVFFKRA